MRILVVFFLLLFLLPFSAFAQTSDSLNSINQKVCDRFEADLTKMAAIMEELRDRKGITETRVAFEGVDTPIKKGDYWVVYAYDAVAFHRAQKFSSKAQLKSSLEVLRNKLLTAKKAVSGALNEKN